MKILCVCDQGNNRSVTFAGILKYVPGFETLTAGFNTNTNETLSMLYEWADKIIVPDSRLLAMVPDKYQDKVKLYDVGPDVYPRPFNKDLYRKCKALMDHDRLT